MHALYLLKPFNSKGYKKTGYTLNVLAIDDEIGILMKITTWSEGKLIESPLDTLKATFNRSSWINITDPITGSSGFR